MSKLYNVIAPVLGQVRADSPELARRHLVTRLRAAGFQVYENPDEHPASLTVFESGQPGTEPQDTEPPGDHELVWESAGTDEPGDQIADSVHRVAPGATSAYYSLGPSLAAPTEDGERWDLDLIQVNDGTGVEIGHTQLGRHPDEQTAKEYAQTWERYGRTYPA